MKRPLYTVKSLYLLGRKQSKLTIMQTLISLSKGLLISVMAGLSFSSLVYAGSLEQAKQLHDRLTGVPATEQTLLNMVELLDDSKPLEAAYLAMETPAFYSTTLKLFATPWTNIDQDNFAPLNDYSATVIGAIRDDVDFRDILQADMVYVGKDDLSLPAVSANNNEHYQALEDQFIDLKNGLERTSQSSLNGLPADATAGVLTSRAAAKAFFYLGTNRAMFRFTLMNHLCTDLEPLKDNTLPPDRIRQDISRSPGGDSRLFINNCLACHSGMDPMAQAFAYYEYDFDRDNDPNGDAGALAYNRSGQVDADTGTRVQGKYHINATSFPYGYVTEDDEWNNYWREGVNQKLGWDSGLSGQGYGAKSLGQEFANSQAFAQCQVKKAFKAVCLRDAESQDDLSQINATTESFKQNNYQMKRVFAEVGNYCMGD